MILSNSQSPNKCLYVVGANLIEIIKADEKEALPTLDLFKKYNENYEVISFAYFNFGLDWLFIVGAVDITHTGEIILCS